MPNLTHCAEFRVKGNSALRPWRAGSHGATIRPMAGPTSTLHVHLRAWRKANRLTLERLANIIGSATSTISGWETGDRTLDLDDLAKLAEAYGVHPAALLFAPPGDAQFDNLREADKALRAMRPDDAADWIKMGRRLADANGGE